MQIQYSCPNCPPQGSFYCGSCKTGFTGDQVKGCKPEISCGNSLTNPCDVNAQCVRERDGSISCQVGFYSPITRSSGLYSHFAHLKVGSWNLCALPVLWGVSFVSKSVELAGPATDTCAGRTLTLMGTLMKSSNARTQAVKRYGKIS